MNVTIHDAFAAGDTVRLAHVDGAEWVADSRVEVKEPCASVTLTSYPDTDDVAILIDRAAGAARGQTPADTPASDAADRVRAFLESDDIGPSWGYSSRWGYGSRSHMLRAADLLTVLRRLESAQTRLAYAKDILVKDAYFRPDEVGDDIAPRMVEWMSHMRGELDRGMPAPLLESLDQLREQVRRHVTDPDDEDGEAIEAAEPDRPELATAITRVRAIHHRDDGGDCRECETTWPCSTWLATETDAERDERHAAERPAAAAAALRAEREAARRALVDKAVEETRRLAGTSCWSLTCAERPAGEHGTCLGPEAGGCGPLGCLCPCHDPEVDGV